MTLSRSAFAVALVLASWSTALVPSAAAQDTLARVKDLYTSAAYDEALALISESERVSTADEAEVDQYRAFCLLALGRSEDARKVILQIVENNPQFVPSDAQASPRLKDAFRDVRRRALPSIVRKTYSEAKASFDRKEFAAAGTRFDSVLALLDDPDLTASSTDLADLRILSKGFVDLIKTTTAPPQVAATPAAAAPPPPAPAPATPPPPAVFGPTDTDVVAPVPISQPMPPWHPSRFDVQTYEGVLVIVIDETGSVASANIQGPLPASYITTLRRMTSAWKFQPAMRNGVPVKYRKVVGIRLSPTGE